MATKPASEPRWADVGGDIVEPSAGKKNVGWVANERPPAQFFNWLLNTIWLWIQWLNSAVVDFGTATVQADVFTVDTTINVSPEQLSHGTLTRYVPIEDFDYSGSVYLNNGRDNTGNGITSVFFNKTNSGAFFGASGSLRLAPGDRLLTLECEVFNNADAGEIQLILDKIDHNTQALTTLAFQGVFGTGVLDLLGVVSAPAGDEWVLAAVGADETWRATIHLTDSLGSSNVTMGGFKYTYDRP